MILEVGARVALQALVGDEESLNGLVGEVVEVLNFEVGNMLKSEPESFTATTYKVRLTDPEHPAQKSGFMDSRTFWPFQLREWWK
jgi:hypothetical protein